MPAFLSGTLGQALVAAVVGVVLGVAGIAGATSVAKNASATDKPAPANVDSVGYADE